MASIAVLPILIGLAVDYAIQFQARFAEARASGSSAPRAAIEAGARGGPVIGTAAVGDDRRVLRPAALADPDGPRLRRAARARGRDRVRARAHRGARVALVARPPTRRPGRRRPPRPGSRRRRRPPVSGPGRIGRRALAFSVAAPGRVLAVGLVLAAAGWIAEHAGRGDLGPARAGPQRPARAPERRRAAGDHRRLRRGRGRGARRRPHRPGGGRLDERLQAAGAGAGRVRRRGHHLRSAGRPAVPVRRPLGPLR